MNDHPPKKKILIVEDDRELAHWIVQYLEKHNFECMHCEDGDKGAEYGLSFYPDAVVLDGMLPGKDGIDVCKIIRKNSDVPILMLTARDEEIDEVLGLEAGANDYLIKPVRLRALLTRINRLIENGGGASDRPNSAPENKIELGALHIDAGSRTVFLHGKAIDLSSKEFDVLFYLAQRAGTVVKRADLVKALRGLEFDGFDRTIDLNISRLRKKLDNKQMRAVHIKTIWGKGYMLAKASS